MPRNFFCVPRFKGVNYHMATSSKQQSTSAAPLLGEESLCSASATAWKRTVMAKQHNAPASTLTVPRRPPPPVPPRPKRKPVPWGQQTDSLVFSNPAPFVKGSDADNDLSRPVQVDHVVYIAVVGATGSGKSSFINNVTGCREIIIADGLMSGNVLLRHIHTQRLISSTGTRHVNEATVQIGSTSVHLVDTPGFNDTELDDEEVCYMLIDWIKEFNLKGLKFSGLLYLHPMNKTREKGSDVQSLKVFKRLIGYENYGNITIGLTFCDLEAADVVAAREQALRESSRFWGDMVAAGAKVVRIPGSKRDAVHLVAQMLNNSTMTLQVEKELQTKPPEAVSAMEEMKDHRELQLIRLKSEMEEATQQILFEERMNLTSQFSTERAALEQQLFEERQAKQFLEGEVLLLKNMVEAEKEDARILKLQHNREEELKKQKAEQDEREKQAREEKEKLECEAEARKEQEANEHARSQIAKIFAYLYSKVTIMRKITNANPAVKRQEVRAIGTSGGAQWHAGLVCHVCWKLFQANEPILGKCNVMPGFTTIFISKAFQDPVNTDNEQLTNIKVKRGSCLSKMYCSTFARIQAV